MTAQQLSATLLCFGAIAMGGTPYLGSPWPGVVLAALSLAPWGWVEWLGRAAGAHVERFERIDAAIREAQDRIRRAEGVAGEHQDQINSLRNAAILRGTLGG